MPVVTDIAAPTIDKATAKARYLMTERVAPPPEVARILRGAPPLAGDGQPALLGGPHFLQVRMSPGGTIRPHFHRMDQWQVVLRGSARVGKQPLEPVSVVYTQSFTPYGPIVGGAEGLEFIDLHACNDWGGDGGNGQSMPLRRDQLERRAGLIHAIKLESRASRPHGGKGYTTTALMEPTGGVMAWRITAGGDQVCQGPHQRDGAGQWFIVLGGAAKLSGVQLSLGLGFFVAADEAAPTFVAGAAGLDLVVLQFSGLPDPRPLKQLRPAVAA